MIKLYEIKFIGIQINQYYFFYFTFLISSKDKVMQEILNSEVWKEEIENGIPQRRFTETTEEKNKANAFFDEMIVQRQASKISHFECF